MAEQRGTERRATVRRDEAVVVFVDVQERFVPSIDGMERLIARLEILARGISTLGVPFLVTEQYPRGLGRTVPRVTEALPTHAAIEKMAFSCWGEERFVAALEATGRPAVILCGIEAHVCVQQTAVDLLDAGFRVFLPADGVSSRFPEDRELALRLLRREGVVVSSVESILFQLLERSDVAEFRAVQALVK